METVSLIIMVLGIIALVAIYFLSRLSRRDMSGRRNLPPIHTINDGEGTPATSVMEDNPALDGKGPTENAQSLEDVVNPGRKARQGGLPPQLVMFIAADDQPDGFAGEDVLRALEKSGLIFGDMNVFHRMVLTEDGERSLFNVANGIKPWTLEPEEMPGLNTPGLSMVLNLPSPIDDREAIHDFVRTAERIAGSLNGVLKNQNQRPITAEERRAFFAMG
ncbi:MAG TPA: cell division protein ZipA C-terminal FtsZ-binding domain-containing protein [Thiolinea sp.]|nr:cell division protein ZipA C-terminal FtsZ-binding domain-containing protein [Thiolinea sp.]